MKVEIKYKDLTPLEKIERILIDKVSKKIMCDKLAEDNSCNPKSVIWAGRSYDYYIAYEEIYHAMQLGGILK